MIPPLMRFTQTRTTRAPSAFYSTVNHKMNNVLVSFFWKYVYFSAGLGGSFGCINGISNGVNFLKEASSKPYDLKTKAIIVSGGILGGIIGGAGGAVGGIKAAPLAFCYVIKISTRQD